MGKWTEIEDRLANRKEQIFSSSRSSYPLALLLAEITGNWQNKSGVFYPVSLTRIYTNKFKAERQ